jgi:hypothetical protein
MTGLAETALETVQKLPSRIPSTGSVLDLNCLDPNVKVMARGRATSDGTLAPPIELYGSATGTGFSYYAIAYRDHIDATDSYNVLYASRDPVNSDLLVPKPSMRPLNFFSAMHVVDVRLTVNYLDNHTVSCQIMLVIMP